MPRHKHEFTALYWHFGPYGDQTAHVHSCFHDGCDRVLIGKGRNCDGKPASHKRKTLTAGDAEETRRKLGESDPSRYDISVLVGPCSLGDAETLMLEIIGFVAGRLGASVSLTTWDETP